MSELTINDRKDLACTINTLADAIATAQATAIDKATIDAGIRLLHQGDQIAYASDHRNVYQLVDGEALDNWLQDVNFVIPQLCPVEDTTIVALPAPQSAPWIEVEQAS
jgi:hypothetical protein